MNEQPKRYTADAIHYRYACSYVHDCISGGDSIVSIALSKVPMNVADMVMQDVMFIFTSGVNGTIVPSHIVQDRTVIVVTDDLEETPGKDVMYYVLHEIAHLHLGHTSEENFGCTPEEYEQREKEADALAREWQSN